MEVDIEQTSQSFDAVSEPPAPIKTETAVEELSQEKETDEQMAAIKRVKKKRKFFDEFDENEMDPPKSKFLNKIIVAYLSSTIVIKKRKILNRTERAAR